MKKNEINLGLRVVVEQEIRDKIDVYCKEHDLNISQLLRRAVKEYLEKDETSSKKEK